MSTSPDALMFEFVYDPPYRMIVPVPGVDETIESNCDAAPCNVSAVVTVCVPDAGRVSVFAVVSSMSRVANVFDPVIVIPPDPVGLNRSVP